jgi:DNA-binding MarR family transcriptional regulator
MQLFNVVAIRQKYQKLYNLGLLQGKAYRQLELNTAALLQKHHLTIQSWKLLGQLNDLSPRRLTDIANILSVKAPLVTVLAEQLFRAEYASYTADTIDRRAKMMSITPKGQQKIVEIEEEIKQLMLSLFANTSIADKITYIQVLEQILENGQKLLQKET